jgi:transcriptional regulator with XRE-family HTH domain
MDAVRLGLALRALRRRRAWTQAQVAHRAGVSRALVARVERGGADRITLRTLERITAALDARTVVRIQWRGEELDRQLDADHARLVEVICRRLVDAGWDVRPETTFAIRGERGSIDVLAFHPVTGSLVVIEVKSVVPDVQGLLAAHDRKVRLAPSIARDLGWAPRHVSRVLVLPDDRTVRRRLARFSTTFDRVMPARTIDVRRWLARPDGPIAGVLFLSIAPAASARHRISAAAAGDQRGAEANR